MDTKSLKISAGVLFLLSLVLIWQIFEIYPDITEVKKEIANQEATNKEAESTLAKVTDFADFSVKNKEGVEKFDSIIPVDEDKANLLSSLEAVASSNGLSTLKIGFIDEDPQTVKKSGQSEEESNTQKNNFAAETLAMSLRGSYSSLKNFLAVMQNDLRIMDVTSINFEKQDKEGAAAGPAEYDYAINFKIYFYKPLKETDINKILGSSDFKDFTASELGFINKKVFTDLVLPADYAVNVEKAEIGNQNIF